MCSILELLYCSSFATTVGEIYVINFVDSGTLTVARIILVVEERKKMESWVKIQLDCIS